MTLLNTAYFSTPIGSVRVVGDEKALFGLDFVDELKKLDERCTSIDSIEEELQLYFQGKLREFKTPLQIEGTPFQKKVWEELRKIPYGTTISYSELAIAIGLPKARRAVAQANGANRFAVLIPCHRVIQADGRIGGYNSGISKKVWLLEHEQEGG